MGSKRVGGWAEAMTKLAESLANPLGISFSETSRKTLPTACLLCAPQPPPPPEERPH